jgi:hypothetical protein
MSKREPYKEQKTPLLIEFTKMQKGGLESVSNVPPALSPEQLEQISNAAIEKAMTVLQDTAKIVNTTIRSLSEDRRPDQAEVSFGIKCDTDNGIIISKASDQATFNVKLVWNNLAKK